MLNNIKKVHNSFLTDIGYYEKFYSRYVILYEENQM